MYCVDTDVTILKVQRGVDKVHVLAWNESDCIGFSNITVILLELKGEG